MYIKKYECLKRMVTKRLRRNREWLIPSMSALLALLAGHKGSLSLEVLSFTQKHGKSLKNEKLSKSEHLVTKVCSINFRISISISISIRELVTNPSVRIIVVLE